MEGSELGDLECGSVQVENNRARSAESSYRFGNLSREGPGVLETQSLGLPTPGWRHAALMIVPASPKPAVEPIRPN